MVAARQPLPCSASEARSALAGLMRSNLATRPGPPVVKSFLFT